MYNTINKLPRDFYLRDVNAVAPELLGKLFVHKSAAGMTAGMIVEVEAYAGPNDKGAHSYLNKRTDRTAVMFGPGGYAYIYFIYGMYNCFNVVTNLADKPEAVLVRALEPVYGIEYMKRRRNTDKLAELCNGPGKLCQALAIDREQYGCDLCGDELYIGSFAEIDKSLIMVSPRVNIDYAEECRDYLWRYFIKENPYVSKAPKRYTELQRPLQGEMTNIGRERDCGKI